MTITSFFIVYASSILLISHIPNLEYVEYTQEEKDQLVEYVLNQYNKIDPIKISKQEIKNEVQKIIKPVFYAEYECNINRSKTKLIERKIYIQANLSIYDYAYVLTHEYIHLAKMIANERLTDYLTITMLHESDNLFLQKVSYCVTYLKINQDNGNEYDCTDQLIKYFSENF